MIIILQPNIDQSSDIYNNVLQHLSNLSKIEFRVHNVEGAHQTLTEIYLIGETTSIPLESISALPGVERVIRIADEYRLLGRHYDHARSTSFEYNGIEFSQENLHVFAGLCAVDNRVNVERMMKALKANGQSCTRMGAYKPRTSPYSFQGHGAKCLPYVFELAGKYDIKVIAMEITHETHLLEIQMALQQTGYPTGIMLQIGTRNTQNFELLKAVGKQQTFPVLLKRGFGITLEESLNAAEYLASEGNTKILFGLRGMKTNAGDPHRNLVDFAHVPVVKRLTRMPVCIDPSHSAGTRAASSDSILEICHVTAQGIIAGANMILVDFHPDPANALVDGAQALLLHELPYFLEDIQIARQAYKQRLALANRFRKEHNIT
ncbi:MAG: 3-deoxy-7-phosphoheptulonate synthase [Gammaproteobacteria bacterium]|nr:3-deoxy-7-phosphoheptulonate synthase [Gammaproteobacteria bacterium]